VGKPDGHDDGLGLGSLDGLRDSRGCVRVLLRSYRGRHEETDASDGGTQRRRFIPDERLTDSVQTSQVEHHQDNDQRHFVIMIYYIYSTFV